MPKLPLTPEQKINLLWLNIKKDNNEVANSTYKVEHSRIANNKPNKHLKRTAIEKEYLRIFTMEGSDFITECFRVQAEIKKRMQSIN